MPQHQIVAGGVNYLEGHVLIWPRHRCRSSPALPLAAWLSCARRSPASGAILRTHRLMASGLPHRMGDIALIGKDCTTTAVPEVRAGLWAVCVAHALRWSRPQTHVTHERSDTNWNSRRERAASPALHTECKSRITWQIEAARRGDCCRAAPGGTTGDLNSSPDLGGMNRAAEWAPTPALRVDETEAMGPNGPQNALNTAMSDPAAGNEHDL